MKTIQLMKSLVIPFLALVILFTGCEEIQPCGFSKDGFLKNYDSFLTKIEEAGKDYDETTWKKKDQLFKQYTSQCYQSHEAEMSLDEKQEFWTGAVGYLSQRYGKDLVYEFNNSDNELIQIVKDNGLEMVEEVFDVFKKEFFNNPKLKDAWNNLKDAVQDAFENIEEELDN